MASPDNKTLMDETGLAVATTNSSSVNLEQIHRELCATILVENNAGGTVDCTIQTSYDGTTWFDVGSFTQISGSGSQELINIDRCLTKVRAQVVNTTGTADVEVRLHYSNWK